MKKTECVKPCSISGYDFDIVHRKGSQMQNADCLSRQDYNEPHIVKGINVVDQSTLDIKTEQRNDGAHGVSNEPCVAQDVI